MVSYFTLNTKNKSDQIRSVAQSCPTLQPHESQHTRLPCPSPTPRVHSNSPLSTRWCHPAISSSVLPFSYCPSICSDHSHLLPRLMQWFPHWLLCLQPWAFCTRSQCEISGVWHHRLDGHESEWTPGVGDGQGGLVCCDSWGCRVGHDWATDLIWSDLIVLGSFPFFVVVSLFLILIF